MLSSDESHVWEAHWKEVPSSGCVWLALSYVLGGSVVAPISNDSELSSSIPSINTCKQWNIVWFFYQWYSLKILFDIVLQFCKLSTLIIITGSIGCNLNLARHYFCFHCKCCNVRFITAVIVEGFLGYSKNIWKYTLFNCELQTDSNNNCLDHKFLFSISVTKIHYYKPLLSRSFKITMVRNT